MLQRIVVAQRAKATLWALWATINDALALRAADVGISVDNAVDIAKELMDVIFEKNSWLYEGGPGRPQGLRQHFEIHPNGRQFELRQYVQRY